MPSFLHKRLGGIINMVESRKSHGGPKQKDFKLPGSLCPIFLHRKVRGINSGLEWRQSFGVPNKFSDAGVTLPQFSHIGMAGITPERRKDGKS